jgi:hypothetical protein
MLDRNRPPSLGRLQGYLFASITGRSRIHRAGGGRRSRRLSLDSIVRGDGRLGSVARLQVYADMYLHRLLDILRADYPKLLAVLGQAAFQRLAAGYLHEFPSQHPSVRHVGHGLPEFVAAHRLAQARPWLAELARLEWARVDVHDRKDDEPLGWAKVQRRAPEALAALPLRLVAAHEIVRPCHAVTDVWRRIEQGGRPGKPAHQETCVLVWRQQSNVYHRVVPADEAALLPHLARGVSFDTICSHLGDNTLAETAARRAAELLAGWASSELLTVSDSAS